MTDRQSGDVTALARTFVECLNRHDAEALRDLLDAGYLNHNPFVSDRARTRLGRGVLHRLARGLPRRLRRL